MEQTNEIIQKQNGDFRKNPLYSQSLVIDIENAYVENVQWSLKNKSSYPRRISIYSFKHETYYYFNLDKDLNGEIKKEVQNLINEHSVTFGYNNIDHDVAILKANGYEFNNYLHVDIMDIIFLFIDKKKVDNKTKFILNKDNELISDVLKKKFKNHKLDSVCEALEIEHQKSDLDTSIFNLPPNLLDLYEETIEEYCKLDVLVVKDLIFYFVDKFKDYEKYFPTEDVNNFKYLTLGPDHYYYKKFQEKFYKHSN